MSETITVITYNIHHGEGLDGKLDLQRFAELIKQHKPDMVALQEVDKNVQRSQIIDETKILGDLTGYKAFFGKSIPLQGGEYGNAVLAADASAVVFKHFPLPGAEARSVLAIQGKSSKDTAFVFACTHLDLKEQHRLQSTTIINDWVLPQTMPVILCGDFNCTPDSNAYKALETVWLPAWGTTPLFTFPANAPQTSIDHTFCYPPASWTVSNIQVLDESVASDHRPVKVTLNLN